MENLVQYRLPLKGMGEGMHTFSFQVDGEFFSNFKDSPVQDGTIELSLEVDKRPGLYAMHFVFSGTVATECDRCLTAIDLPIAGEQHLLVKLAEEDKGEEAEVVYIHPETPHLNVARFAYEFIVLAIPMIKVYACDLEEPRKCNMQLLAYLEEQEQPAEDNPLWDELKKLNIKHN